jgi:hypothetical protein
MTKERPYIVGEFRVATITVKSVGFMAFTHAMAGVGKMDDAKASARAWFRARVRLQCEAKNTSSQIMPLDDAAISLMPLPYAIAVKEAIDEVLSSSGKIAAMLHKGDGIVSPIHIKLGDAITSGNGKTIDELEFVAENFDELEDAILADGDMEKAAALIGIAKPVGADMTLLRLPAWAVDQISLSDGAWIMKNVSPSFFQMPAGS